MITDREGVIEYVNPAFEAVSGYTPGELMGQTPRVLKSGQQNLNSTRRCGKPFSRATCFAAPW